MASTGRAALPWNDLQLGTVWRSPPQLNNLKKHHWRGFTYLNELYSNSNYPRCFLSILLFFLASDPPPKRENICRNARCCQKSRGSGEEVGLAGRIGRYRCLNLAACFFLEGGGRRAAGGAPTCTLANVLYVKKQRVMMGVVVYTS